MLERASSAGRVGEDVTIAMTVVGALEGDDRNMEWIRGRL